MLFRYAPILLAASILSSCSRPGTSSTASPMGEGETEDQQGRRAWDLERMMDPATGAIPIDIRRKELAFAKKLPVRAGAKSLTWTWRGPKNRGGRTRAFAVDRTNTQRLFAGGVTGGMWLSEDAGASWTKTTAPGSNHSSSCITQDPRAGHENEWYYGSGENYGVVSGTSFSALLPGDGIFKSNDGGNNWTQLASTIAGDHENYTRNGSFKQVNSIAVDPVRMDSDIVLAAVFNGVFRSNDGGANWNAVLGIDTTTISVSDYSEVRVTSTGVYYAAISNGGPAEGLWRSADGITWNIITPTGFSSAAQRCVIGLDPSNDSLVWFFANTPGAGLHAHQLFRYLYLSGDGSGAGGAWSNRTPNLPNGNCLGYFTFNFGFINTQDGYDMAIAVHPDSSDIVYIGGTSVYRSTDGWNTLGNYQWIGGYHCDSVDPKNYVWPNHHPDQHGLVFDPLDHTRLYSVNDGGAFVSTAALADSMIWNELNTGYGTSQFYTIHLEAADMGNDHLLGGLQDNGMYASLTADANDAWARVHQDDGAFGALPSSANFILTSSQSGRIYKKNVDADFNITGFERIDPVGYTGTYNFINAFILDPLNNDRLYMLAGGRVWRKDSLSYLPVTDDWYNKDSSYWWNISQSQIPSLRASILGMSHADNRFLMYGTTAGGRIYRLDSLHTAAPVRTEVTVPEMPSGYVSCLASNDLNADEWIATFSNYGIPSVWHTTDGGTSWQDVSGNLEENADGSGSGPAVFWARIYATWNGTDDRYFAGTSTGLYSTALLDGANTIWEQEGPASIGNVPVNMIAARNYDGLIAVATHGNGVYSAHLPAAPIGVNETGEGAPLTAWPNPTSDHLTIKLTTGTSAVEVTDASGRSILRQSVNSGSSSWTWDLRSTSGDRVPSGTYLILIAEGNRQHIVRAVVH